MPTTLLVLLGGARADDLRPERMPFLHGLAVRGSHARLRPLPGSAPLAAVLGGPAPDAPPHAEPQEAPVAHRGPRWPWQRVVPSPCEAAPAPWSVTPIAAHCHAEGFAVADHLADPPARDEDMFRALLRELRAGPAFRLIAARLRGVDLAGHRSGPGSPEARHALHAADRRLAALHAALSASNPRWNLVVVAPHGMAPVARTLQPRAALPARAAGSWAMAVEPAVARLWCESADRAAFARVLRQPGARVIEDAERQCLGLGRRAWGDLLIAAEPGHAFTAHKRVALGGAHGYIDARLEGRGFLVLASSEHAGRGDLGERPLTDAFTMTAQRVGLEVAPGELAMPAGLSEPSRAPDTIPAR